jgi:hypothetical protein
MPTCYTLKKKNLYRCNRFSRNHKSDLMLRTSLKVSGCPSASASTKLFPTVSPNESTKIEIVRKLAKSSGYNIPTTFINIQRIPSLLVRLWSTELCRAWPASKTGLETGFRRKTFVCLSFFVLKAQVVGKFHDYYIT